MELQDIVNNYNKRNSDINSSLPTKEQDLDVQAAPSPIATDVTESIDPKSNVAPSPIKNRVIPLDINDTVVTPQVNTDVVKKYPNKPDTISDSNYEHLISIGYSPESISNYTKPYDPSTNGSYLERIYESSMTKPKELDENKIKKAKLISEVGDALGLLSQMWSAGKGAYVKERGFDESAQARTQAQEKELRNIYQKQKNNYDTGLASARLKNFMKGLDEYNNGRKGIYEALSNKQKLDIAKDQFEQKQQLAHVKLERDQANKDRDYELKKQNTQSQVAQRDAYVKQGWSRVADSRNRTTAYIKKTTSENGKNSELQLIIPANPNDTNAKENELGENVKEMTLTKAEIDSYTRAAKRDPSFFDRHSYLLLSKPDKYTGAGKTTYASNEDIAAAYAKEVYDKQFRTQPSAIPSTATTPFFNWRTNISQSNMDTLNSGATEEDVISDDDTDELFPIL